MDANDEKINAVLQFANRLIDENHYDRDKIHKKAESINERSATYDDNFHALVLYTESGLVKFPLKTFLSEGIFSWYWKYCISSLMPFHW